MLKPKLLGSIKTLKPAKTLATFPPGISVAKTEEKAQAPSLSRPPLFPSANVTYFPLWLRYPLTPIS